VTHKISIAGSGKVGRALGAALSQHGWRVEWIASRTPGPVRHPLLIAVSDDAVGSVAAAIARSESQAGIALHTSGVHGVEALESLSAKGWSCGTLHPLQTVTADAPGAIFEGAGFAISGGAAATDFAERIAAALGGFTFEVADEKRAAYHAAAVMASNYVTALAHAAEQLLGLAGVSASDARRALAPLMRQSVDNALRLGPAAALTGPLRRGDAGAVAAHLAALAPASESIDRLYRACGTYTLEVAREAGLSGEQAGRIEEILTTECKHH
jgi:predicted short-subunit dehydrogenase-like oxidoreductase (DUF2520 family)